ncbi:GntR family transcriptional regulator [Paenibacillus tengchongensis]|uniref:GntR family transcriptional regulator n=1 Tax=Paenibacillus tengchongensis TaxID=2608684 RepID=UPI001651DE51|nr:GntR family transcriptional regulator [Paenibacillus tengchongensis]
MAKQLREQLRQLILSGRLPHGLKLPSIRQLAGQLSCNQVIIRRVYLELEQEGLIVPRRGVGTFVCRPQECTVRERSEQLLYHAFREAAEIGRNSDFSAEEIQAVLQKVLAGSQR